VILLPGGGDVAFDGPLVGGDALARFAAGVDALRDAVTNEALDAAALRGRLLGIAALATEAAQAAAPALPAFGLSDIDDDEAIYDRYFEVARTAAAMPRAQFAASALAAWADVLADLPETLLGRDEIASLLAGIGATCAWLGVEAAA
jgi:hypothetical protein